MKVFLKKKKIISCSCKNKKIFLIILYVFSSQNDKEKNISYMEVHKYDEKRYQRVKISIERHKIFDLILKKVFALGKCFETKMRSIAANIKFIHK